mmetsp:Transcript_95214/g.218062  ORF Transcript_95214/g.218062 Transcript_95214/m.218062 type:complete len:81 (+) Transcript_95214:1251-1493(+)
MQAAGHRDDTDEGSNDGGGCGAGDAAGDSDSDYQGPLAAAPLRLAVVGAASGERTMAARQTDWAPPRKRAPPRSQGTTQE